MAQQHLTGRNNAELNCKSVAIFLILDYGGHAIFKYEIFFFAQRIILHSLCTAKAFLPQHMLNIFPIKFIALTLNVLSFLSPPLPLASSSPSLVYLQYLLFGSFSNAQRHSISMCLQLNENLLENTTTEQKCKLSCSPQQVFSFPHSRVQEFVCLQHRPSMVVLSTAYHWFRLHIFLFPVPARPSLMKVFCFAFVFLSHIQITECENNQMSPQRKSCISLGTAQPPSFSEDLSCFFFSPKLIVWQSSGQPSFSKSVLG